MTKPMVMLATSCALLAAVSCRSAPKESAQPRAIRVKKVKASAPRDVNHVYHATQNEIVRYRCPQPQNWDGTLTSCHKEHSGSLEAFRKRLPDPGYEKALKALKRGIETREAVLDERYTDDAMEAKVEQALKALFVTDGSLPAGFDIKLHRFLHRQIRVMDQAEAKALAGDLLRESLKTKKRRTELAVESRKKLKNKLLKNRREGRSPRDLLVDYLREERIISARVLPEPGFSLTAWIRPAFFEAFGRKTTPAKEKPLPEAYDAGHYRVRFPGLDLNQLKDQKFLFRNKAFAKLSEDGGPVDPSPDFRWPGSGLKDPKNAPYCILRTSNGFSSIERGTKLHMVYVYTPADTTAGGSTEGTGAEGSQRRLTVVMADRPTRMTNEVALDCQKRSATQKRPSPWTDEDLRAVMGRHAEVEYYRLDD